MSRRELTPDWDSWAWDMVEIDCDKYSNTYPQISIFRDERSETEYSREGSGTEAAECLKQASRRRSATRVCGICREENRDLVSCSFEITG